LKILVQPRGHIEIYERKGDFAIDFRAKCELVAETL
jgi:hypothetical protein